MSREGFPPGPFPPAAVIYGGESYSATGFIRVSTPTAVVGPLVTSPFTLSGEIHAKNFNSMGAELDFEIFGAGTVTAGYSQYPLPDGFLWYTRGISYTIEPPPIPEPTSWVLLGSGLLGLAARRRSTRLKNLAPRRRRVSGDLLDGRSENETG